MEEDAAPLVEFHRRSLAVPGVPAAYGYRGEGLTPGLHRGLPSRHLTMIFGIDGPVVTAADASSFDRGDTTAFDTLVGGLHVRPAYVAQPERQEGIQLAVHPLAARRLFGMPAAELVAGTYRGDDVLGAEMRALLERLAEIDGDDPWPRRLRLVEDHLRGRADRADGQGPRWEVAAGWQFLAARGGQASIGDLAREVGLSTRHVTTLFRRELGVVPKTLASLMRFDHAVLAVGDRVRAGRPPDLAQVAAGCGYYDQAHLAREFRRFTGIAPSALIAEEFANIQSGGHQPPTG